MFQMLGWTNFSKQFDGRIIPQSQRQWKPFFIKNLGLASFGYQGVSQCK
jgi:hypothetical protein